MIVFNFDVLARPNKELGARLPDPDGLRLWKMLYEQTLGRMAVVVDESVDLAIFEHWLKLNGIKAAVYDVLDTHDPMIKAEKIHKLSMAMGRSDWYIDNDPVTAAITMKLGIPTLLVCNPYIVRPEWVGTKAQKPWDALVQEIDEQAEMKANKTWGEGPLYGEDL